MALNDRTARSVTVTLSSHVSPSRLLRLWRPDAGGERRADLASEMLQVAT